MSEIDVSYFKELLLARQSELASLAETSAEARAPVELDQTTQGRLSRMDAMQGQAMALETERRRTAELGRIISALNRIEAGDFGYCVGCDELISESRLKLDPSLPTCINCAG